MLQITVHAVFCRQNTTRTRGEALRFLDIWERLAERGVIALFTEDRRLWRALFDIAVVVEHTPVGRGRTLPDYGITGGRLIAIWA